jgi:ABC-2 type transport system ATP-binding protein
MVDQLVRPDRVNDVVEATTSVSVEHLRKTFGPTTAVDDVSFEVRPGEVFAFLGPNGAGKSTTINVLCTLAMPTSGRCTVAGHDVVSDADQVRQRIGLVFQEQTLDNQLTAAENLRFHAVLYGLSRKDAAGRIEKVLDLVKLGDRGRDLVSTFSGGMCRRLEIARAMLHTPAVMFLDEPTIGLDPQTRALMWEDVLTLRREENITIFVTTHYMDEADVADRIAIIDHGRIVALDTPDRLRALVGADTVTLETTDDATARTSLLSHGWKVHAGSDALTVFCEDGERAIPSLIGETGVGVRAVRVHRPTLDDVFLHFTGREIRREGPEGGMSEMARVWGARHR